MTPSTNEDHDEDGEMQGRASCGEKCVKVKRRKSQGQESQQQPEGQVMIKRI